MPADDGDDGDDVIDDGEGNEVADDEEEEEEKEEENEKEMYELLNQPNGLSTGITNRNRQWSFLKAIREEKAGQCCDDLEIFVFTKSN